MPDTEKRTFLGRHQTLHAWIWFLAILVVLALLSAGRGDPEPSARTADPYEYYDQYDEPASGPHGMD